MSLVLPRGDATVYRPSVYPSVTFMYPDHIGWNTSKIISSSNKIVICNVAILAQSSADFELIQFSGHSYIGRIARSSLR